jgi:hypothetical protein
MAIAKIICMGRNQFAIGTARNRRLLIQIFLILGIVTCRFVAMERVGKARFREDGE